MEIPYLKEYILENNKVELVLEKIGCHHIKQRDGYITCGNPDGDNPNAITVYTRNNMLIVNDYTRNIKEGDGHPYTDLFDLVCYFEQCNFFQALNKICQWVGIDYYCDYEKIEDLDEALILTKILAGLMDIKLKKSKKSNSNYNNDDCNNVQKETEDDKEDDDDDNDWEDWEDWDENDYDEYYEEKNNQEKPNPISEKILDYYLPTVNDIFAEDNISYETQREFEIGYDCETNRITIPIRNELGQLMGVKGRFFQKNVPKDELKYVYIEKCPRSQILYGLNKTYDYIKEKGIVFVGEAEKSVMQLWDAGIRNCVATGGKKVSRSQIKKLSMLDSDIVFCFDKDVTQEELKKLSNRFSNDINIYALIDNHDILDNKESPTDDISKFKLLYEKCLIKLN